LTSSDSNTVRIYEIYDSIQGESTLAGTPCTLIRLAGCPLRCSYCDTRPALPFESGKEYDIDHVADDVYRRGRPLVLVTGGEPLAQKSCLPLLSVLADICPVLQLETSGAFDISRTDTKVRRILDIKTPGSGEESRNHWENLDALKNGDEIKIVITSRVDYQWALNVLNNHRPAVPVLFSPAWGSIRAAELVRWMLEDHAPARFQLQLHKHIWGAEASGV